jgi:hypothetical protein
MNYDVMPTVPETTDSILARVDELRDLNQSHLKMRQIIRGILNGGAQAVQHLLADSELEFLPAANLLHSAIERTAQKLVHPPTVKCDAPLHRDSARSRSRAEKRERIVEGYDRAANLRMQIPQLARWLPGYGFAPWVIDSRTTDDNQPYPGLSLRDPFGCIPGPWTVHQQPQDLAFVRRVPENMIRRVYPHLPPNLRPRRYSMGGVVMLDNVGHGKWENQSDSDMLRVIEYRNRTGTYLVLEDAEILLDHEPTPEGVGTPFVVAKRFSFDELIGQFDHVVGLQQMIARMNILAFLSVQDAVFAETNVLGEMTQSDDYRRGRGAVNYFTQGTRIERMGDRSNTEAFQQTDRLERQLRLTGAYPVADDGQSPNSFVTGKGLEELGSSADNVVNEYQLVIANALETADRKRLCWDEKMWPNTQRTLPGRRKGSPFVENYVPSKDISSDHETRRVYGVMAGLDSSTKLIGLLQIAQAGWLDDISAMENLDGIDDIQLVLNRINRQKARELLDQAMMASLQGSPLDDRVLRVLVDSLESGPEKKRFMDVFFPEEPEAEIAAPAPQEPEPLAQPGEDVGTVLSRIMAGGQTTAGAQVVQTT